jgi:hypothetical protein
MHPHNRVAPARPAVQCDHVRALWQGPGHPAGREHPLLPALPVRRRKGIGMTFLLTGIII